MRVHQVAPGTMPAMPPKVQGTQGAKLPGGLCPRGMRNQWSNGAGQHTRVSKPKEYRHASASWYAIERDLHTGRRAYDPQ